MAKEMKNELKSMIQTQEHNFLKKLNPDASIQAIIIFQFITSRLEHDNHKISPATLFNI